MKTVIMECSECHGTMQLDEEKAQGIMVCPYCGKKEMIIESDMVKIEKIKAEKEIQKTTLKQVYRKEKENRSVKIGKNILIGIGIFYLLLILFLLYYSYNEVNIPFDSNELLNKPLSEVITLIKDVGFRKIEISTEANLHDAFLSDKAGQVGMVSKVTINGDSDFKKAGFLRSADVFHKSDTVHIWYYSYPEGNEKNAALDQYSKLIKKYQK